MGDERCARIVRSGRFSTCAFPVREPPHPYPGGGRKTGNKGGHAAHSAESASACGKTHCTAASCGSGGEPCFRSMRFISTRILARAVSRRIQATDALPVTLDTNLWALTYSAGCPIMLRVLSLTAGVSPDAISPFSEPGFLTSGSERVRV